MAPRVVTFDSKNRVSFSSVTSVASQGHLLLFTNTVQDDIHLGKMVCYQLPADDALMRAECTKGTISTEEEKILRHLDNGGKRKE